LLHRLADPNGPSTTPQAILNTDIPSDLARLAQWVQSEEAKTCEEEICIFHLHVIYHILVAMLESPDIDSVYLQDYYLVKGFMIDMAERWRMGGEFIS